MKAHILFCLLPFWCCTLQAQAPLQSWMETGILTKMKHSTVQDLAAVMPPAEVRSYRKRIAALNKDTLSCPWLLVGLSEAGKMAVTGQVAAHLGRDLFRVETSALKGKYIGETEKNLAALFRTAESKQWILFFDEADALFGRRTQTGTPEAQIPGMLLNGLKRFQGVSMIAMQESEQAEAVKAQLPCSRAPGDR